MPGGGMKRKETLEQAARRECHEEAGVEMQKIELFGIFLITVIGRAIILSSFYSEDFTMTDKKDSEIAEKRFFPLDDLPEALGSGHRRRCRNTKRA